MRPAHVGALVRRVGCALAIGWLQSCAAAGWPLQDPLDVAGPAGRDLLQGLGSSVGAIAGCELGPLPHPLDLVSAVERALCADPEARAAWLNARVAATQLGLAYSAFLPTVSASSTGTRLSSHTTQGASRSDDGQKSLTHQVELDYLLYDFGARSANAKRYEQLLLAAGHARDSAVQQVFLSACSTYYQAQAAVDLLAAAEAAKRAARDSLHAIQARYVSGVASQADRLQASIAFSEAELAVVRAEADRRVAFGALASAIGLRPDAELEVPVSPDFLPDDEFSGEIDALFQDMQKTNPQILAAQAQLVAAQQQARSVEAGGAPSVSLQMVRSANRTHPFASGGIRSANQSYSVGFIVSIPLFDGFSRSYQVAQARVGVDAAANGVASVQQAAALNLWSSYQALVKSSTGLRLDAELLASAKESYRVAQGRYQAGVGDVLQLLTAQASLASADIDRIQTLTNWKISKLTLLYHLGRLSFSELRGSGH
jgi:outer membrane protein